MTGNILFIDTAYRGISIGIMREDGEIFTHFEDTQRGQAELLVPLVMILLDKAQLSLQDIDHLVVNRGPGSFTGIRIGLATVMGYKIAQGNTLKIGSVDSFNVISLHVHCAAPYAIVLETKRSDFCVQFFDQNGVVISDPAAFEAEEFSALLIEKNIHHIFGDAVDRFIEMTDSSLSGTQIDCLDIEKILLGIRGSDILVNENLTPLYLKGAKISFSKKKQRIL